MLKKEYQIDQIKTSLIYWKSVIDLSGQLNLLNGHVISESFFCELLNIIYGYNMHNENEYKQNIEGLDLADHTNKILMQVTATKSRKKIMDTIHKLDFEQYKDYSLFMVYINEISSKRKEPIIPKFLKFDIEDNIINIAKIMSKIIGLDSSKMDKVHKLITEQVGFTPMCEDNVSLSSDLVLVLNALSKNNFKDFHKKNVPLPFEINEKIRENNLIFNADIIGKNYKFYTLMQTIYDTYDKEADNTSESVWEKITEFGRDISMNEHLEGDLLFTAIWNKTLEYVTDDPDLLKLTKEKVEYCIKIIVADAFTRCKIMKRPSKKEGDPYAFT